jgi:hypothetical protein
MICISRILPKHDFRRRTYKLLHRTFDLVNGVNVPNEVQNPVQGDYNVSDSMTSLEGIPLFLPVSVFPRVISSWSTQRALKKMGLLGPQAYLSNFLY